MLSEIALQIIMKQMYLYLLVVHLLVCLIKCLHLLFFFHKTNNGFYFIRSIEQQSLLRYPVIKRHFSSKQLDYDLNVVVQHFILENTESPLLFR
jgi:hypothetical protein